MCCVGVACVLRICWGHFWIALRVTFGPSRHNVGLCRTHPKTQKQYNHYNKPISTQHTHSTNLPAWRRWLYPVAAVASTSIRAGSFMQWWLGSCVWITARGKHTVLLSKWRPGCCVWSVSGGKHTSGGSHAKGRASDNFVWFTEYVVVEIGVLQNMGLSKHVVPKQTNMLLRTAGSARQILARAARCAGG
jgi:hypothetical protein